MSAALEVNGKTIERDENGNLRDPHDWNEDVARALAALEGIELTEKHFDVLNYLRSCYFDNNGEQPMERAINKGMSDYWGVKVGSKELYDLFPLAPSKQGNRIAGLPFVLRKGGY